ncbi:MAG: NAD-glutamate dehydrogenase domain-containing protein [Planctomycetota bacterium]
MTESGRRSPWIARAALLVRNNSLEEYLQSNAGTWEERFSRALGEGGAANDGQRTLVERYRRAFPEEYQLRTLPAEALEDVRQLEEVRAKSDDEVGFAILRNAADLESQTCRLRVYLRRNVYLSTLLPILDKFGLQIIDQSAYRIEPAGQPTCHVQTFRVAGISSADHPLLTRREMVIDALHMVFTGRVDNDVLNRLTVELGIAWRDVDLLRAYINYLHQLGAAHTGVFMADTFCQHANITRALLEHHKVRFDPALGIDKSQREQRAAALVEEIHGALVAVLSPAQDNFLRLLLNLLSATLRTSHFQTRDATAEHRVSFKVDPAHIVLGTEPRPWREIFVHSHEVEGVHLRGGRLARGGVRWSDRIGDYREEILGLMRTQMVKNVLIVPVGAKGGFVIRRPHADPAKRRAQADQLYSIYIHALLDITDNVVDGAVVRPASVICYDEDDPYLVVAADKGTAHLSNTANAISLSRNFWMADAFASGGKNGYDHKALGITARGAWVGVRRHLLEMGIDFEKSTITVAGIGDMSGDVFGNGLIESNRLKLLAAFNHAHIFLDPDPDPALSFQERKRLFALPSSTWKDYKQTAISAGGGVFDRQAKSVRLSPQARALLDLDREDQRPDDVIRAILTMKVDLLWNGGIGTYIKGSKEDSRDVGDLTNSGVRVDAKLVKARVVAEGGNLGSTQAGRVELAQRGCRINTDFVDNSGGVNCSDHEVNIKILLARQVQAGRLTLVERNRLLESLSDDVCQLVLQGNYDHNLMISLDELRSRRDLFALERTIKTLEDRGIISRERERLPSFENLLHRQAQGNGLTRPELAVLDAYAKMEVYRRMLAMPPEGLPAEGLPDVAGVLAGYFPPRIVELYGADLKNHLLSREIAMTLLTNTLVDRAGAAYLFDVERETGASMQEIVRATMLVDELFGGAGLRAKLLERETHVPVARIYDTVLVIDEAERRAVAWVLGASGSGRLARLERDRAEYAKMLAEYHLQLPDCLGRVDTQRFHDNTALFLELGVDAAVVRRLVNTVHTPAGLRIVDAARETRTPVAEVTKLYFRLGQESSIFALVRRCDDKVYPGRWESLALRIIRNSILDSLLGLTVKLVHELARSGDRDWVDHAAARAKRIPQLVELRVDLKKLVGEDLTIGALQVMSARLARVLASV